jgi:hypothetical protein
VEGATQGRKAMPRSVQRQAASSRKAQRLPILGCKSGVHKQPARLASKTSQCIWPTPNRACLPPAS